MDYQFDKIINRKGTNSIKWELTFIGGKAEPRPMSDDPLDPNELLPLWVADMDFASPPPVIDALCKRAAHGVFGYSIPTGDYFNAIINWMQKRHNWTVEKDWIFTAPGVVPTLNFLVQAYTEVGDNVLIQTPVYHPFYSAIENNDRNLAHNPLILADGQYHIDFADLEAKLSDPLTKMMIVCSPHNPTGTVWDPADLCKIADLCIANDVLIVADEIHHDLIHSWSTFTTMAVACPHAIDRMIITTAPSKTFNIPGLKTSNVFIPNPELREKFSNVLMRCGLFGVSVFGIVGLQTAYAEGEDWLEAALAYIEANYLYLVDYLAENMPQVTTIKPGGTYLGWVDFRALGMDSDTLYNWLLEDAKVYLNNGAGFGEAGAGFARFNLACPRAVLTEALNRIHGAMQKL